jgi:Mce-associated membrane protein
VVVETEASAAAVAGAAVGASASAGAGAGAPRAVSGLRAMAGRRATVMAALTAVVVLAAGVAVFSALRVGALHGGNSAVADTAATAQVTDQVGSDVKAIFSYDYDNLARTERAASSVLVDEAVGQYQAGYAAAKQQVTDQKLVRTTTISSIAAQDLRGDTAHLLVFLDQQTLTTTSNQQSSASAALSVTARKVDGTWKIASMTAL